MKLFNLNKLFLLFLCFAPTSVFSTLMYNQYDPMAYHTIYGINKTYKKQDSKFQASINLSPFYQHASYAKDGDGNKVPEGDIFGWWNLFGLFYGVSGNEIKAAPTTKTFVLNGAVPNIPNAATRSSYPTLTAAWRVLDQKNENVVAPENTDYNLVGPDDIKFNYTDPAQFDSNTFRKYMPLSYVDYEKFGVRTQINFNFDIGLGINLKGGLVDYKQVPIFENYTFEDATDDDKFNPTWPATDNDGYIYKYLRRPDVMEDVLSEVGLDISKRQETTLEDTHIEVYFQLPFEVMDNDDEHVLTFVPYLAAGIWLPTGKEKNQDAAFSIPTGNDGFWGITVDGQLSFDIPGSMQFGFGAGVAYYFDRNLDDYRVASHKYQQGIFPWKAKINKEPGLLWNFNATVKAVEFIDNFSVYMDFIYLRHNRDTITMREDDSARNAYFVPKVNEENSKWWATMFQGGVEYKFSPGIQMGLGFQSHLSGRRVYRNTTVLGTMSFVF